MPFTKLILRRAAFATVFAVASLPALADATCKIADADLQANQKLTFDEFDQAGVLPSTARKLSEAGCFAEAVTAGEHYLLFGPPRTQREGSIVAWHLAQNLAMSGDESAAARVATTAIRAHDVRDEVDGFEWNVYVRGTWAFLSKQRPLLKASIAQLHAAGGERNAMNARVLESLDQCFAKPYREAYNVKACQVTPAQ